jgi:hypothetical protein
MAFLDVTSDVTGADAEAMARAPRSSADRAPDVFAGDCEGWDRAPFLLGGRKTDDRAYAARRT